MGNDHQPKIIYEPISKLEFTEDFREISGTMGFATLQDIIETAPEVILKKQGFNYNWFGELIKFLSDRKLLHLLQPLPGNIPN